MVVVRVRIAIEKEAEERISRNESSDCFFAQARVRMPERIKYCASISEVAKRAFQIWGIHKLNSRLPMTAVLRFQNSFKSKKSVQRAKSAKIGLTNKAPWMERSLKNKASHTG